MQELLKASLTYKGETVNMDDKPASETLVRKMLLDIIPRSKGGTMEVRISFPVMEVRTKTQRSDAGALVTTVHLETLMKEEDIARLWYMQRKGVPIICDISSPQAEMDLLIKPINLKTGEIKEPALAGSKTTS